MGDVIICAVLAVLSAVPIPYSHFRKAGRPAAGAQIITTQAHRDGGRFRINEYFVANPRMMLGDMANAGTMYRSNEPALIADGRDLASAMREAIAALPEGVYRAAEKIATQVATQPVVAQDDVKENAFTLHDGVIAIRTVRRPAAR